MNVGLSSDHREPAATVILRCEVGGLEEMESKLDEISACLSRASKLICEISGTHELRFDIVDRSAR
jgi:hypothetical protein